MKNETKNSEELDIRLNQIQENKIKAKQEEEEEKVDLTERYVEPHNIESRLVVDSDLNRVMEEAHIMFNLCFTPHKMYNGAAALAHQQIEDKDPLRFFVTRDKKLIINPVITNHTRHTIDSSEGCLSFAEYPEKVVQRYNKIEVEYYTLVGTGDLSEIIKESLSGMEAKVFQHEIDHLDCKYIYDEKEVEELEKERKEFLKEKEEKETKK